MTCLLPTLSTKLKRSVTTAVNHFHPIIPGTDTCSLYHADCRSWVKTSHTLLALRTYLLSVTAYLSRRLQQPQEELCENGDLGRQVAGQLQGHPRSPRLGQENLAVVPVTEGKETKTTRKQWY